MTDRVLDALCEHSSADAFVLSEYRIRKAGDLVASRLREAGWPYALHAKIPAGKKGAVIYSRTPIEDARVLIPDWKPDGLDLSQWIVAAYIPAADLSILGVYVPYPDGPLKEAVWSQIIDVAGRKCGSRLLITGDFNSAWPHDADSGTGYTTWRLREMRNVAIDLWSYANPEPVARDQITWEGPNGKGTRLDFAFATPALVGHVTSVVHSHGPRLSKVSDHSQVVIELDGKGGYQ
jgi:exodeoxyribonuclease-3